MADCEDKKAWDRWLCRLGNAIQRISSGVYAVKVVIVNGGTGDSEGLATAAKQDTIIEDIGEVQESPTSAYSVLGRLKSIATSLAGYLTVVGSSDVVSVAVANTAEAYVGTSTAPVCVGTKLTFASSLRVNGGTGIIQTIKLIDTSNTKPALVLLLFNADMTNGTYTNKSAPVLSTDVSNCIGFLQINTSDWQSAGGNAFIDINPTKLFKGGSGSTTIYGILLTTGSHTFGSANALTVKLGIMRD